MAVGHDVCRFQKLIAAEPADGAVALIRLQDALAGFMLMQALLKEARRVAPSNLGFR